MKKPAKRRGTFTLDVSVLEDLEKVCNVTKVPKSAFVNDCLRDQLDMYRSLFPNGKIEDFTISEAFKYLGKKAKEMEDEMELQENEFNNKNKAM